MCLQKAKSKLEQELLASLKEIIAAPRLYINEPMSRHTSFQIGGPADFLVFPASVQEVSAVFTLVRELGVPVLALGNGSNVLVSDKGIRGVVVKFGDDFAGIRHLGKTVIAGAGASLTSVSRYAADCALTGMEFAVGIPGSIGGAVFMNAGAYDGEISKVISAVTTVCPDGTVQRFNHADIRFDYRQSVFQQNGCIICEVELMLEQGSEKDILAKMDEYTNSRETKQPLEMPSAGSTFKRPPGYYAGTLIEQTGLKGFSIGGAQVSNKHAGFVVNAGGATAADVLALISEVQRRVFDKFGVRLQPEVRVIGEK
ncbi:MAG: UDP-N-acetylenolpyruvoylglucosamine reductase [Firmicutes bacterium]|nr:UDP-N-acetylenolpyruvoylglucosamine reductase [Bacillota bacterium]